MTNGMTARFGAHGFPNEVSGIASGEKESLFYDREAQRLRAVSVLILTDC
jgi:hypothetical protein